jgi:uncharacterized protein YciI
MDLEAFELVILRRAASPPACDEQTGVRLQRQHIAFLDSLRQTGQAVATGPLRDQADQGMRGLVVYRTGSIEEARRIAHGDPLVQAGQLEADVMTWLCKPGTMKRPGRPVRVDDA